MTDPYLNQQIRQALSGVHQCLVGNVWWNIEHVTRDGFESFTRDDNASGSTLNDPDVRFAGMHFRIAVNDAVDQRHAMRWNVDERLGIEDCATGHLGFGRQLRDFDSLQFSSGPMRGVIRLDGGRPAAEAQRSADAVSTTTAPSNSDLTA